MSNSLAITDHELRANHEFVSAFEQLRRQFNLRDMHDSALQHIAAETGIDYLALRTARSLRNAIAHDDKVNRDTLERHLAILTGRTTNTPASAQSPSTQSGSAGPDPSVSAARSGPERGSAGPSRAFRIHAWRNAALEASMLANGFVSVGGSEIGDLTNVTDPDQISAALTASMTDRTPTAIRLFVGYWRRFLWDAEVGDIVLLPTQTQGVAIGTFASPYFYVPAAAEHARHRRQVDWRRTGLDRNTFSSEVQRVLSGRHTIQTVPEKLVEDLVGALG